MNLIFQYMKQIIILGPQGAGKGTQANIIAEFLGIKSLSSGEMLRKAILKKTELGQKIKELYNKGSLIPDNDMIALIREELGEYDYKKGFVLDGFPRNIIQAKALDKYYNIDKVLNIDISDKEAVRRIQGRLICANGHIFNTHIKQASKGDVCSICGKLLYSREDDKTEAVMKRLSIYHHNTVKLLDYYQKQNKLVVFNGLGSIEDVSKKILEYLKNHVR